MPYFPNAATHAEHAVTAERTAPDTMRQGPRRDPTPKKILTLKPGTLLLCHGPCAVQFSRPPAPLGRLGSGRKTPERQSSTRWTTALLGLIVSSPCKNAALLHDGLTVARCRYQLKFEPKDRPDVDAAQAGPAYEDVRQIKTRAHRRHPEECATAGTLSPPSMQARRLQKPQETGE